MGHVPSQERMGHMLIRLVRSPAHAELFVDGIQASLEVKSFTKNNALAK